MLTTFAALAAAAAALIVYDARTYRNTRLEDLSTLADVMGAASGPALAFDDLKEAEENLALLRVRPTILAGALYKADGKPFVVFAQNASELGPVVLPAQPATGVDDVRLALCKPVLE
jgi:hypothetical protein